MLLKEVTRCNCKYSFGILIACDRCTVRWVKCDSHLIETKLVDKQKNRLVYSYTSVMNIEIIFKIFVKPVTVNDEENQEHSITVKEDLNRNED